MRSTLSPRPAKHGYAGELRIIGARFYYLVIDDVTAPTPADPTPAGPIANDVFALDMAMLAYQSYHQSLLWPLDPWYEEWSRVGSSRRDNTLANTHRLVAGHIDLRGPGSTRRWPTNSALDPIITRYGNLQPWHGSVTNDGITYHYLSTHSSIVDPIRDVVMCEYGEHRFGRPIDPQFGPVTANPSATTAATDHLYAFEGATGSIDDRPPAWSLMGVVLERHDASSDTGDYDVHIAYRGSQSGSAYRAAFEGLMLESGNPDWVTDMEIFKTVADPRFSPQGRVVRGLRDAVLSSLGSIVHCLQDIAERNDRPPNQIHISGHSLGGALATQLTAAFAVGNITHTLSTELRDWPWDCIALTSFSAPKAGDLEFVEHVDSTLPSRRVFAAGDPITQFPAYAHVGEPIELDTGLSGTVTHEPSVVRQAIVDALRPDPELTDAVRNQHRHRPWRDFDSLGSALLAAEDDGDMVRDAIAGAAAYREPLFVALASTVIEAPSSYRLPWTKPAAELRRRGQRTRTLLTTPVSSLPGLRRQMRKVVGVQPGSGVEDYLRQVLIVTHAHHTGWTASQLLGDRVIAKALGPRPERGARAWLKSKWAGLRPRR